MEAYPAVDDTDSSNIYRPARSVPAISALSRRNLPIQEALPLSPTRMSRVDDHAEPRGRPFRKRFTTGWNRSRPDIPIFRSPTTRFINFLIPLTDAKI